MSEHFFEGYRDAEQTLRLPDLHQALYDGDTVLLPRTVVCLHGEEHAKKKRIFSGVFNRRFFKHYQNHVFPKAIKETMDPAIAAGVGDMAKFAYRVLINLTADSAGIDRQHTEADTDRLLALLGKLGHAPTMGQLTDPSDRDRLLVELQEALEVFRTEFFEPSLARRRDIPAQFAAVKIENLDLPQDAITAQLLSDPTDENLPYDERMKDAAFFILAGAFTTAKADEHGQRNPRLAGGPPRRPEGAVAGSGPDAKIHLGKHPPARRQPDHQAARPVPDGSARRRHSDTDEFVTIDLTKSNRRPELFGEDAQALSTRTARPRRTCRCTGCPLAAAPMCALTSCWRSA